MKRRLMPKKKKPENLTEQYEDWESGKAERREKKKAKKILFKRTGAYEIWKMKAEKAEKQAGKTEKS